MRAGKSNKPSLAERLDALPLPAGSSFAKETAWEKLHDRLYGKKKNRKKAMFVWLISVPVAASLFYFLFMSGGDKIENGKIKSTITSGGGMTKTPGQPPKEILVEEAPVIQSISRNKSRQSTVIQKPDKRESVNQQPGNEITTIDTQTAVSLMPANDSASSVTAIAGVQTPKNKLRVVHNNELSGSPSTIPNDPGNTVASTGPTRFFPGLRRPAFNNPEETNDDTIRKLKSKRSLLPFSSFISQKE